MNLHLDEQTIEENTIIVYKKCIDNINVNVHPSDGTHFSLKPDFNSFWLLGGFKSIILCLFAMFFGK
jgi:hypothetical protein